MSKTRKKQVLDDSNKAGKIGTPYFKEVRNEIREHKSSFIVFCVLVAFVILTLIEQVLLRNHQGTFLCIFTLLLLTVPAMVQTSFKIELPTTLEIIVLVFIFSAQILGEINNFYGTYENWDTILHTLNGFLAAAIGCSLISLLNKNDKITFTLSPLFVAIVAFCFSMMIGVVWEFFEYFMDVFTQSDMQKDTILTSFSSVALNPDGLNVPVIVSGIDEVMINGEALGVGGYIDIGLHDTMEDMIVNAVGALIFSVVSFFYTKRKGKSKLAPRFVPTRKKMRK